MRQLLQINHFQLALTRKTGPLPVVSPVIFPAVYKSLASVPGSEVQTKKRGATGLACALITNGHNNLRIWWKLALMAWAVDVH